MPKKQVRNAFYFFMKEEEPKLRREGRVFPNGMADMVPVCHPRWKTLPDKEKDRFEKMAKEYKQKMKGKEGDKFRLDNQNNVLAYRINPHQENERRRLNEKKIMTKNWPSGIELAKEKFYLISFQILCVTEDEHYLPCEIALIEFSIEKGITKHMHRFIEPGKIPTGYRFACLEHSQDTHQIPIENFELADSNYLGLWNQIENFINPNGEKNEYPPLYCLGAEENYKMVEYCLDLIHGRACMGIPNRIKHVFEVESLYQELFLHIGKTVTKFGCISELTTSRWDYEPNTKCSYHEELECKYCALGIVNRFAYQICDSLAKHYDVKLTDKHVPMRKEIKGVTILPPSSMPVFTNQTVRPQPRIQTYSKPQRKEIIDDEYSDLRKPKEPSQYGVGEPSSHFAWGGAMGGVQQDNIPSMGRGRGMQYDSDFPSVSGGMGGAFNNGPSPMPMGGPFNSGPSPMPMGRGLSTAFQGMSLNNKHAGRAEGPPASSAPDPPAPWRQPISVGFQEPMGIGRGMIAKNQSNVSAPPPGFNSTPPGFSSAPPSYNSNPPAGYTGRTGVTDGGNEDYTPLRMPGQKSETQVEPPTNTAPKVKIGRGTGHGYGGILEKLMKDGIKNGVSRGRGLAPDDWVDDGSLGPRRK